MNWFSQKEINNRIKNAVYYMLLEFHDELMRMLGWNVEEAFDISEGAMERNEKFFFDTARQLARKAERIAKKKFTAEEKAKEIKKARHLQYFMENLEHLPTEQELF